MSNPTTTSRNSSGSTGAFRGRDGFTLVEILLAMLISSVLVLGLYAAQKQARMVIVREEGAERVYQQARLLTELLRSELSSAYAPQFGPPQQGQDAPEETANVFTLSSLPDGGTRLEFYTLNPSFKSSHRSARPARVSYRFSRSDEVDGYVLTRSQQAYAGEKPIGSAEDTTLAVGLGEFELSAFDQEEKEWKQSYESQQSLPRAARIKLRWSSNIDPHETVFLSSVLISSSAPMIP